MAIDPYASCPGGTGKKIKFCCPQLVGDLEQLDRLIEGDQISAALEMAKRLDTANPGRACLLATKTKLELAAQRFDDAAATNRAFVQACPDNPLAVAQQSVCDALLGQMQEAAAAFDRARAMLPAGQEVPVEVVRVATTLIQAAAQGGQVGLAQGLLDWMREKSLGSDEDRRLLAAVIGSSGVPPALRARMPLQTTPADSPWRFEFQSALDDAKAWRLAKALTGFRSLKGVAAGSRELFTDIALVCEMLALPFEAAEAWLVVARCEGLSHDEAVEATGRAVALEQQADPDRSPTVSFTRMAGEIPAGEGGPADLDLLEDRLRHDGRFEPAAFNRSDWVSRNAAPPRSVWRVYEGPADAQRPARLLGSLLIFGKQTDREPEGLLQGFSPDLAEARPIVEALLGGPLAPLETPPGVPTLTPTAWLLSAQFRPPRPAADERSKPDTAELFDRAVAAQDEALWSRFAATWPDTAIPELLGKSPRQAVADRDLRRRVEAIITEQEATARQPDATAGWAALRDTLGIPQPGSVESARPVEELPPMRWHRVPLNNVDNEQLRLLFLTSLHTGFDLAAARAAERLVALSDDPQTGEGIQPQDRWDALGLLESRAATTGEKLEILATMRKLATGLGMGEGMLDVAELRIRLQRGEQTEFLRLLERLRGEAQRDPRVLEALAEVLAEAGIDLSSLAARPAAAEAPAEPQAGKLWTPGGSSPTDEGGEKKVLWTPGS